MTTHRLEYFTPSYREPRPVAKTLPPDARDRLIQAAKSKGDPPIRLRAISTAIRTVKMLYPQFFKEQ